MLLSYYSNFPYRTPSMLSSAFSLSFSMTVKLSNLSTIILIVVITSSLLHIAVVKSLGTASTIALTYSTPTACGIVAGEPTQRIQCYQNGRSISMQPNISFEAISGGLNFLCGLRSGGLAILCWETADITTQFSSLQPKRIYYSNTVRLTDLTVGDVQVCAREVYSGMVKCWRGVARRGSSFPSPGVDLRFSTIASGSGFTCGILMNSSRVHCWGNNDVGTEIERQFSNLTMLNLVSGESHACGLTRGGILVCKGSNSSRQLDVPFNSAFEFSGLAAGANFTCAVKQRNGLVTCWGKTDLFQLDSYVSENYSFELIVAGMNFLCGLTTSNLSMICWGKGWYNDLNHRNDLPLGMIIPGSCIQSSCSTCGMYPNSETLCGGSGSICKSCRIERPLALPLPPITPPPPEEAQQALLVQSRNKLSLAFMIVGSLGAFTGISTIVYCLGGFLHKRYCNTVQPSITDVNVNTGGSVSNHYIAQSVRSFSIKSLGSTRLGFQRNGSSSRLTEKTQNFSLPELLAASNNFSLENKVGAGSFGTVYRGKLHGGREVAIKRGETGTKTRKFQEKESAFDSELALLPRLHHKHLLGLIGFCEENDERLLVYEYMSNGALYDHLHSKENTEKSSSLLNSWKMRIKIALDAARGIEYLHNYAVPPIIHRDIKSSNILLDSSWTAKVSDFGLSLMGPESDQQFMSTRAVGTVGYIDPEYYVLNVLTAKSDVYGLGVVLLELLTGKRAVFRNDEGGAGPMAVVEYATPLIAAGMLRSVLDERVGQPGMPETEAVELMAYTALHSVKLEGKERPNITDIVANLERALALCEEVHTSFSSTTFSIPSD